MKRFRNIMLVVQGSTDAPQVVKAHEAASLAKANNAKLALYAVVPSAPRIQESLRLGAHDDPISELLRADRLARLSALADSLDVRDVGVGVAIGSPPREIVRHVNDAGHDLVIVLADGSDATSATIRQILRICPCPVWVLKAGFTGERVLAAVDPDDDAQLNRLILELARSQALRHGGELRVVHAWEPYGCSVLVNSDHVDAPPQALASFAAEAEAAHRAALDSTLSTAGFDGDVGIHLIEGSPRRAIAGMIQLYRTDLLVMGSVGSADPDRSVVGGTAEQILKDVGCSVLIAKPPNFVPRQEDRGFTREPR